MKRTAFAPLICATLLAAVPAIAQPPETRLVQFVLLEGSTAGASKTGELPDNVRPALDDVRQLLPFRSYRLLDVALIRTNRIARTSMRGPGGAEYSVRAQLREQRDGEKRFEVWSFDVAKIVRAAEGQGGQGAGAGEGGEGGQRPIRAEEVIETSFAAEVGKTVVVGTSRLNGGEQALIALFTAIK